MVIRSTSTRLKAPSATLPIHFFFRLKENSLFLKFPVSFKDEIMDGIKSDFIQLQCSFVIALNIFKLNDWKWWHDHDSWGTGWHGLTQIFYLKICIQILTTLLGRKTKFPQISSDWMLCQAHHPIHVTWCCSLRLRCDIANVCQQSTKVLTGTFRIGRINSFHMIKPEHCDRSYSHFMKLISVVCNILRFIKCNKKLTKLFVHDNRICVKLRFQVAL